MSSFKLDTMLSMEEKGLLENEIHNYITRNMNVFHFKTGGSKELIKVHLHTNDPGALLTYCASLGDMDGIKATNIE